MPTRWNVPETNNPQNERHTDMNWTQTISGKKIDLLHPKAESVDFYDIAHQLAHVNRFSGATDRPYSVAEHCCRVSLSLKAEGHTPLVQFVGLLHDAHEAYMGDIITPVQNVLCELSRQAGTHPGYIEDAFRELKLGLDRAIFEAAGLNRLDPEINEAINGPIKIIDKRMMMTERDAIGAEPPEPWGGGLEELERLSAHDDLCWRTAGARDAWWRLFHHLHCDVFQKDAAA